MTWNYRIIKRDGTSKTYFAVHEVFYNDKSEITNWTEQPIDIIGESKADIKSILKRMSLDIETAVLSETDLLKITGSHEKNRN